MKRDWIKEVQEIEPHFFNKFAQVNHSLNHDNPYHREANGNLLGHILNVYHQACKLFPYDSILQLAALLHDAGKPMCYQYTLETQRINFNNHESFGTFLVIDLLHKLNISHKDKIRVIELIARHGDHWKLSQKNIISRYDNQSLHDLHSIAVCDTFGSIKDEPNSGVFGEYMDIFQSIPPKQKPVTEQQCTLLIGPPCSGKTTYIRENNLDNTPVISRDRLVNIYGESDDYNKAWDNCDHEQVNTILSKQIQAYSKELDNFIVDMTNMTVKTRTKFTQLPRQVHAVVFVPSLPTLLDRNLHRDNKLLETKIITDMCKRFQPPYPGEQFASIKYIFN